MTSPTIAKGPYAVQVSGAAAAQFDAAPGAVRSRVMGDLSTLAEQAAAMNPPPPPRWVSELCLSQEQMWWRIEVDHSAHRVRLIELRTH
jgi:hypothetical protein